MRWQATASSTAISVIVVSLLVLGATVGGQAVGATLEASAGEDQPREASMVGGPSGFFQQQAVETTVGLSPADDTIPVGGTTTYDVVVDSAVGGVGAYDFSVSVSTGVASITNVELAGNPSPQTTDVEIAKDGGSVDVTAALANTSNSGSVTIATITVSGDADGASTVDLSVDALGNEDGDSYTLSAVTDASLTVGENDPPTADAGDDQTVDAGSSVDLSAEGSSDPDGDALDYEWTQTDGPDVSLDDADSATASFTAPDVDEETALTFEVAVTDGEATDTDTVEITIQPVVENGAPDADAGNDRSVGAGSTVDLSAEGSSDPDGDALDYEWTQTDGTDVSLDGVDSATASFTAPDVDEQTTLTFQVAVTDSELTDTDTVNVNVVPLDGNEAPTADAGDDGTITAGSTVDLSAEGSSDPDGDSLSYDWTQTGGPDVSMDGADASSLSFTAPDVDEEATLTFELAVDDGEETDTDTVEITVVPLSENGVPDADAGDDETVDPGESVALSGEDSSDPDGDALDYDWTQTDGPDVDIDDADSATASFTAPDVDEEATLTFELTVDDGEETDTDTVEITVESESASDGEESSDETYYQVDLVAGEPIENLGPEDSDNFYSDQGRLIQYIHGSSEDPITDRGRPGTLDADIENCVDDQDISVEDGTATVSFTVEHDCDVELSLVSYTKPDDGWSRETADEQELYGATTQAYSAGSHTLTVDLPTNDD